MIGSRYPDSKYSWMSRNRGHRTDNSATTSILDLVAFVLRTTIPTKTLQKHPRHKHEKIRAFLQFKTNHNRLLENYSDQFIGCDLNDAEEFAKLAMTYAKIRRREAFEIVTLKLRYESPRYNTSETRVRVKPNDEVNCK
jgi:hypothetical protein